MPLSISESKVFSRFFCKTVIPNTKLKNIKFVYNYFVPDEGVNQTGVTNYDRGFPSGGSIAGASYFVDSDGNKMMTAPDGSTSSSSDVLMRSPRQVELTWASPVSEGDLIYQDAFEPVFLISEAASLGLLVHEEDVRSALDTSITMFDPRLDRRIQSKTNLYTKMCEIDPYGTSGGSEFVAHPGILPNDIMYYAKWLDNAANGGLNSIQSNVLKLFSLNEAEETKRINELSPEDPIPAFLAAKSALMETYVDRRMIRDLADSAASRDTFLRTKFLRYYSDDATQRAQLPLEKDPPIEKITQSADRQKEINIETPGLPAWALENSATSLENTTSTNYSMTKLVGYVVNRYDGTILDLNEPSRTFFIESGLMASPNVVDSEVLYGHEYYYSVRSVYCREFLDIDASDNAPKRMQQWLASKPTEPLYIETVEQVPPKEPDGLFYKFNYGAGKGLLMSWQYPADRKRDTKYFQVFRRKSIKEPFTCIAEIDFNDAHVKYPRREKVDDDRVLKYSGVQTFYEDREFDRDSDYIYAIASVDAHGLTSGYSHQTNVSFNRFRNELVLKGISRSGAPKQYPNFFVDPDMDETTFVRTFTQDVMKVSGKQKVHIYFNPDCESFERGVAAAVPVGGVPMMLPETNLVTTSGGDDSVGLYKIHFINTDRQKDDSLEIRVDDFRGVDVYAQE